jgi:hypothetical protein
MNQEIIQRKKFDFEGLEIDTDDEADFGKVIDYILALPSGQPQIVLPALYERLRSEEETEGEFAVARELVAGVMAQALHRHMHAPPTLDVAALVPILNLLWDETVQTGVEHGGILLRNLADDAYEFKAAPAGGSDGHSFEANTHQWDRQAEDLEAIVHTHPNSTSFSGTDLGAQFASRAGVEYIRTGSQILAIVRSGDFENRMRQRITEFGDAQAVQEQIVADFEENMAIATESFIASEEAPEDEGERDRYLDRCQAFAISHAVRRYAVWMNTGYYEGPADGSEPLKRRF